jgi:hypothetical protein
MEIKSLGVLSVATNKYIDYWEELATSLDTCCPSEGIKVKMYVFTDQVERANLHAETLRNVTVEAIEIESYKWPEATLYRYRIFEKQLPLIHEELLMHLDADMKVEKWFTQYIPDNLTIGVGLVSHPGYYRPKSWSKVLFYWKNPWKFWADTRMRFIEGGIGSWDRNSDSLAFVPRHTRTNYVCGGTWIGLRGPFVAMVNQLSQMEQASTNKGIMPRWHDESILNKWFADNRPSLLSPAFCFDPTYPQLEGLTELIRAVDKGNIQK